HSAGRRCTPRSFRSSIRSPAGRSRSRRRCRRISKTCWPSCGPDEMTQVACIAPDWRPASGVRALYTTRQAGDMTDPRVAPTGLPTRPRWLTQVHGIAVADLDLLPEDCGAPVADASITTLRNVVCVVRTADCLPVLLAAADGSGGGAAHRSEERR